MMNYKEFCEYVESHIVEYIPRGCGEYSVEVNDVTKNNGKIKRGISLLPKGENIAPVIYLDDAYEQYKDGKPTEMILKGMVKVLLDVEQAKKLPDFFNFEAIKDKIGFELVNCSNNRERLKDKVWKPVEDLAKAYRVVFIDENSISAALIPEELFRHWGITMDELDFLAEANMEKMFPPMMFDIVDSIALGPLKSPENLLEKESLSEENRMLILTNSRKAMGAATMLYSGVLEKVSEMMGEDLIIIPSSTEEVIILPKSCSMPPKEIGKMVREVNGNMSQEEVLSDRVYEFTYRQSKLRQIPESLPPVKKPKDMER